MLNVDATHILLSQCHRITVNLEHRYAPMMLMYHSESANSQG